MTLRDIKKGEILLEDYGTFESDDNAELEAWCG
jgi:hypothetical protein